MTTFQDPPPQSRRAARQNERGEAAETPVGPSFVQQPLTDQPSDMWDTTARRVSQLPTAQPRPEGEQPAQGRRAAAVPEPLTYATQQRPQVPTYDGPFRNTQAPADDQRAFEDGDLPPTQALPKAEQPTYRMRDYSPEARPAAAAWAAATNPAPPAPPSDLEYQTEARRLTAVPPLPPEPTPAPISAVPSGTVPPLAVVPPVTAVPPLPPEPEAPPVSAASTPASAPETTLSRRELRARLLAEAAYDAPVAEPIPLVEPAPWQQQTTQPPAADEPPTQLLPAAPSEPAPAAPTAFSETQTTSDVPQAWPFAFGTPAPSAPAEPEPQAFQQPAAPEPEQPAYEAPVFEAPAAPAAEAPAAQAPEAPAAETPVEDGARALFGDIMTPISAPLTVTPEPPTPPTGFPSVAPEPVANTELTNAISEFDSLAFGAPAAPQAAVPQPEVPAAFPFAESPAAPVAEPEAPAEEEPAASSTPTSAWSPPVGHWSRQMDLDDETQPFESTINRRVGSGSTTTNALVLPNLDRDIRGALTGTGEVMLTGSIDLPATLSSTGAHDRVEHQDLDRLFDANDHEIVATDSAPVRAIRAVSTHHTGQSVTHTQKPKGTKGLTILLIATCVAAAVGLGMLVTAIVLNVF